MSERSHLTALAALLAVVVACLSWAVVGSVDTQCNVIQLGSSDLSVKDQAELCGEWFSYSPLEDAETPRIIDRQKRGPVDGTVVIWHDEKGWGVLASPEVDGRVWAHFSSIRRSGFRNLAPGQPVRFTYITPGQDGFPNQATSVQPR